MLAIKNALAPERPLARARYGQLSGVPTRFSRAEPASAAPTELGRAEVARLAAEFRRNGVVRLPSDQRELVGRVAERYASSTSRRGTT